MIIFKKKFIIKLFLEFLRNYDIEGSSRCYEPRGLMNSRNWCYLNSVLQGLLACSPFYALFSKLPKCRGPPPSGQKSATPIIDSM